MIAKFKATLPPHCCCFVSDRKQNLGHSFPKTRNPYQGESLSVKKQRQELMRIVNGPGQNQRDGHTETDSSIWQFFGKSS